MLPGDAIFRLGAWLAGLDSYIASGGVTFTDHVGASGAEDHIRDLRLARGALQRCVRMTFMIITSPDGVPLDAAVSADELRELSAAFRETLFMAESLDRAGTLSLIEWQTWCGVFRDRFADIPAYTKLIMLTETGGEDHLPEILQNTGAGMIEPHPELDVILPRFGRILRMLDIIGEMLEADEPLKPALLIFAKVNEMTQELINYLNQRVERAPDASDEFLGSLDGAAYMASIELKKVVQQELAGLSSIRPSTTVYARIEAAHALLTESFQYLLSGFARQIDPEVDVFSLFPSFGVKLDRSIVLRKKIYDVLTIVQKAEQQPEDANITKMNQALIAYMDDGVESMFYKDTETFERFVEEILVTREKKDLVPILHRFGAYLETLFGQVNMRAVLQKHPFEH